MQHLFLNYELSKLAKEKGFDEPCFAYYKSNETDIWVGFRFNNPEHNTVSIAKDVYKEESKYIIFAPLYQQIIDWLAEKHDLHIISIPEYYKNGKIKSFGWEISNWTIGNSQGGFKTKYLALNKAIEEAFKLMK